MTERAYCASPTGRQLVSCGNSLRSPLAIILLAASAISAALGELINAFIIVLMVLFKRGRDYENTYRRRRLRVQ